MTTRSNAPHPIRVAVCQILVIDGDRSGNFRRIEYALQTATAGDAAIASFPESAVLGWENPDAHSLACAIPGPDSDRIASLAREFGLMICIGLDEKVGNRLYDSAVLVDRSGTILWKHRKMRVLAELMEPAYSAGKPADIGVVDTEHGRVGVLICADMFGDSYVRRLGGLDPHLVLVPFGWAADAAEWPQHAQSLVDLVARRAAELACPVVGTDLVGVMSQGPWKGRTYGGSSVVADGTGKVVAVLRDRDVEVRVVEIDVSRLVGE